MTREALYDEMVLFVSRILQKQVGLDTRLIDGGGYVDSVNIAELLMALEERYSVSFAEELELDFLEDVRTLAENVYAKVGREPGKG
ncbi:MAG: phosphopantetheine-binding protein [Clostridium sp.]|jgi:acyl carrier protein|nr:phosphopantetheine-binding protein [Clostridium sp.]